MSRFAVRFSAVRVVNFGSFGSFRNLFGSLCTDFCSFRILSLPVYYKTFLQGSFDIFSRPFFNDYLADLRLIWHTFEEKRQVFSPGTCYTGVFFSAVL